jgi:hypothetical protein
MNSCENCHSSFINEVSTLTLELDQRVNLVLITFPSHQTKSWESFPFKLQSVVLNNLQFLEVFND